MLKRLAQELNQCTPPITADDVGLAVAKLKSGKSLGWDLVSTDHLIHMQPMLYDFMAVLFKF